MNRIQSIYVIMYINICKIQNISNIFKESDSTICPSMYIFLTCPICVCELISFRIYMSMS